MYNLVWQSQSGYPAAILILIVARLCHRRIVAGSNTRTTLRRLGHSRVIHTSSARSLPRSGKRAGRRLKAILS